jgi:hypothetical protein
LRIGAARHTAAIVRAVLVGGSLCFGKNAHAQTCRLSVYVSTHQADTLAIETLRSGGSRYDDFIRVVAQGAAVHLSSTLGSDGLVDSILVRIWDSADSTNPPAQVAGMRTTSDVWTGHVVDKARGGESLRDSVPKGSLPYMPNYLLFLQVLMRRFHAIGRDSASIPLEWLFTTGRNDLAKVQEAGRDSVHVACGTLTYEILMDSGGLVQWARASNGVTIRRVSCAPM